MMNYQIEDAALYKFLFMGAAGIGASIFARSLYKAFWSAKHQDPVAMETDAVAMDTKAVRNETHFKPVEPTRVVTEPVRVPKNRNTVVKHTNLIPRSAKADVVPKGANGDVTAKIAMKIEPSHKRVISPTKNEEKVVRYKKDHHETSLSSLQKFEDRVLGTYRSHGSWFRSVEEADAQPFFVILLNMEGRLSAHHLDTMVRYISRTAQSKLKGSDPALLADWVAGRATGKNSQVMTVANEDVLEKMYQKAKQYGVQTLRVGDKGLGLGPTRIGHLKRVLL